jgi:hypothetical protein
VKPSWRPPAEAAFYMDVWSGTTRDPARCRLFGVRAASIDLIAAFVKIEIAKINSEFAALCSRRRYALTLARRWSFAGRTEISFRTAVTPGTQRAIASACARW